MMRIALKNYFMDIRANVSKHSMEQVDRNVLNINTPVGS